MALCRLVRRASRNAKTHVSIPWNMPHVDCGMGVLVYVTHVPLGVYGMEVLCNYDSRISRTVGAYYHSGSGLLL